MLSYTIYSSAAGKARTLAEEAERRGDHSLARRIDNALRDAKSCITDFDTPKEFDSATRKLRRVTDDLDWMMH